jgi:deazaflavin-dependent oxidoreductase (nitroreductase family)
MDQQIIEEFRGNAGVVGGYFEGKPLLLLHSTGAKSGAARIHPLMFSRDGDRLVIFATVGGAPKNPGWYHNLVANPDTVVEVGTETFPVKASVAGPDDRERLWERHKTEYPQFAQVEAKTTRQIPVILLERTA